MKEIIQEDVYLGPADRGQKRPLIGTTPVVPQDIEQRKEKFIEENTR